jgi:hypothetical protein
MKQGLDLLRLKRKNEELNLLLSMAGPFTSGIIEEVGNAIRLYLENNQISQSLVSDVFAVYIEQVQNIRNYLARFPDGPESQVIGLSGIVTIGQQDGHYSVMSGNAILDSDAPELERRLENLRAMDKNELKAAYKRQLGRRGAEESGKGAGLGLILMARRASAALEYDFERLDGNYRFFTIRVVI